MRYLMKTSIWSYFLINKEEMIRWEIPMCIRPCGMYCSVLPSLPSGISGRLRSNISAFAVP